MSGAILINFAVSFILAAAISSFFYSAKLFYECLLSKKRSHRGSYDIRSIDLNGLFFTKRASTLGLASIAGLFFTCAFIIPLLLLKGSSEFDAIIDYSVIISPHSHQKGFYAVHKILSLVVSFGIVAYLAFKKKPMPLSWVIPWLVSVLAVCALM